MFQPESTAADTKTTTPAPTTDSDDFAQEGSGDTAREGSGDSPDWLSSKKGGKKKNGKVLGNGRIVNSEKESKKKKNGKKKNGNNKGKGKGNGSKLIKEDKGHAAIEFTSVAFIACGIAFILFVAVKEKIRKGYLPLQDGKQEEPNERTPLIP